MDDVPQPLTDLEPSLKISRPLWQKVSIVVILLIAFIGIVLLIVPRIIDKFSNRPSANDIGLIDDSDLALSMVSVPRVDNAYYDLEKIAGVLHVSEDKKDTIRSMLAGKTWDDVLVANLISQNTQALSFFAEAAKKPKFQDPAAADITNISANTPLPQLSVWLDASRLSALRALYLARRGSDEEAMEEALYSVEIGQRIQESQGLLIEYLVATAIKDLGLETVHSVVRGSKFSSIELSKYSQRLNSFSKNEHGLITAFKLEYLSSTSLIDALASGNTTFLDDDSQEWVDTNLSEFGSAPFQNGYYFDPDQTKLLFAGLYREYVKSATQSCWEIREFEIQKLVPDLTKLGAEKNAIGKWLHDALGGSLVTASRKKCEETLLLAATQTLIATEAYRRDNGEYPTSLDALVPNYISSVPLDPFDGKLIKYSAIKRMVYSIGQDMLDTGGSTGDDWRRMADPTFSF